MYADAPWPPAAPDYGYYGGPSSYSYSYGAPAAAASYYPVGASSAYLHTEPYSTWVPTPSPHWPEAYHAPGYSSRQRPDHDSFSQPQPPPRDAYQRRASAPNLAPANNGHGWETSSPPQRPREDYDAASPQRGSPPKPNHHPRGSGASQYGGDRRSEAPTALSRVSSNWSTYSAWLPKDMRQPKRKAMTPSLLKAHRNEHVPAAPLSQQRDLVSGEDDMSFLEAHASRHRRDQRVRVDPPHPGAPPPPPNPAARLSLSESLVLLKAHDQGVFQEQERLLDYILCGAFILELAMMRRLEAHPNTIRYPTELTFRVVDNSPVDSELLQTALERLDTATRSQEKTMFAAVNLLYLALKESMTKTLLNRCIHKGWLTQRADSNRRTEYRIKDQRAYEEARSAIDKLMDMRDNEDEPPIRFSVLGTLYWAPQDYTNYCFGRAIEAYPAQQFCKAFIYAVQRFTSGM